MIPLHTIARRGGEPMLFWDFDIGWTGSMHDANLWGMIAIG